LKEKNERKKERMRERRTGIIRGRRTEINRTEIIRGRRTEIRGRKRKEGMKGVIK
jgi:hypothetical protein